MLESVLKDLNLSHRRKGKTSNVFLALEERLTPAGGGATGNTWTDLLGTKSWSDDLNWSLKHVPTSFENAIFDSVAGSSDNCNWSGGSAPGGIVVHANYPGTVTYNAAMEVGINGVELDGGNFSQPAVGDTLTIDGPFNWTGGNLNTSGVLSTVTVQGGGTMSGGGGSVSSFSSIIVPQNTFYMSASSRTFNGSAGITIQNGGTLIWNAPGTFVNNGTGYISNAGTIYVNPGFAETCTSQLPIVNNANSSILQVGGADGLRTLVVAGARSGASVNQTAGVTILHNGSILEVSSVLAISGGELDTYGPASASITGNVSVEGSAQIYLNKTDSLGTGALSITGSLNMTGGTLNVKIDPFNEVYDSITTTGNITLGGNPVLNITTINPNNEQVPAGFEAEYLSTSAGSSINGGDTWNYQGLAFNGGSWGHGVEHTPQGDDYYLTS
jgi:hypothetical protein